MFLLRSNTLTLLRTRSTQSTSFTRSSVRNLTTHDTHPSLDITTFGSLAPWALSRLSPGNSPSTAVLIRHHDTQSYLVQRALLSTTCRLATCVSDDGILDLTAHATQAGLMFLYWLFHRRLAGEGECALLGPGEETGYGHVEEQQRRERERREHFTRGLIESWVLGSLVGATGFQNDVLKEAAKRLHREEGKALRSLNPRVSNAIFWSRVAFDHCAAMDVEQRNLSDFAVDVAAKRVYEVGMNGFPLSIAEKEALSTNTSFAQEVFGSLGGQIGTKGVEIQDFARAYLIECDGRNREMP